MCQFAKHQMLETRAWKTAPDTATLVRTRDEKLDTRQPGGDGIPESLGQSLESWSLFRLYTETGDLRVGGRSEEILKPHSQSRSPKGLGGGSAQDTGQLRVSLVVSAHEPLDLKEAFLLGVLSPQHMALRGNGNTASIPVGTVAFQVPVLKAGAQP